MAGQKYPAILIYHEADTAVRSRFGESFRPATQGSTFAAGVDLIVWCKACRHQVEPDVADLVSRYGAELPVPEWSVLRMRLQGC